MAPLLDADPIRIRHCELLTFGPILLRLDAVMHPLLDLEVSAHRRVDITFVWPVEAPMIDKTRFRLFRDVRIESGTPEGSDILGAG